MSCGTIKIDITLIESAKVTCCRMLPAATFDLVLPQLHTIMVHLDNLLKPTIAFVLAILILSLVAGVVTGSPLPKDRQGLTIHPILQDLATRMDPMNDIQV